MQQAAAAGLLAAALLLPLVSPYPQLGREPDTTSDTDDDDIGPRHMFGGGWRGNELWRDRWHPREWGRPPFFRPSRWPPRPPPPLPPPPPLDADGPFIPFEDTEPSSSPSTTTTTTAGGTTRRGCDCPVTSEFNPVCGTDLVSYPNPGRLHCARDCGKRVEIYHMGNCVTTSTAQPRGAGG
ncbi:uncharacterized protein LOC126163032 isoform X2 [Schistocerca cancellata]|uniref:uncharacterized protein LOC126163032 isoform X1 n=1 Tax=Schistocerca cancellata TaxID=274614 RepID=UPI002119B315|nr:uncharacterized protein LOC126163032 isoform X1 [Schistocerca cancellata]XP_049775875.1 uncharacterized protein LOC126163032 isoform X2 [Schistocerca cancellata]